MVCLEVLGNGQFGLADSTQDGLLVEPFSRPRHCLVVRAVLVTSKTGVITLTALEFERDDVAIGVVVSTPGFRIDVDAADGRARHGVYRVGSTGRDPFEVVIGQTAGCGNRDLVSTTTAKTDWQQ